MTLPPDTTLWTLASGNGPTYCIEELRLTADNALQKDWEHGRALHTLIDALETATLNEEIEGVCDDLANDSSELEDCTDDCRQSFDDSIGDLVSTIETTFTNAASDLEAFEKTLTMKDALLELRRVERNVLQALETHKTHRETILELEKKLKTMANSIDESVTKLRPNP